MGNDNHNPAASGSTFRDFPMQKYLSQGVSQQ